MMTSARFERAMESTRDALASARSAPGSPPRIAILGPDVWDPHDYTSGLHVFVGVPSDRLDARFLSVEEVLAHLDREAWLSGTATRVYVGLEDGSISAVARREDLPIERWRRIAADSAARGLGLSIALVLVTTSPDGG